MATDPERDTHALTKRSGAQGLQAGLSVVIPVYNSEQSLPLLVERLQPVLHQQFPDGAFELILVNDGSRDRSWAVVEELTAAHPWIRGFDLMRNFGQHNAVLCGLRAARYDVTVTMDDDLQHPPEELPTLLEALVSDVDVVYGWPGNEQHGFLRDLASTVTKIALQRMMGAETARRISAWRALRTKLRDAFERFRGSFVSMDVLLTWATHRFAVVTLRHEPRLQGRSNYTFSMLIRHAMNMVTGFSTMPLQLASWTGFAFTLFGLGVLAYVVLNVLIRGVAVQGFAFLASLIAIFSGAQLMVLGIIGEYLARMHVRIMDRPSYVVRSSLGAPNVRA